MSDNEQMITISCAELKNLIKEAVAENRSAGGGSIFNRSNYIKKRNMSFT